MLDIDGLPPYQKAKEEERITMRIRVGNLSPEIDNDDLEDIFTEIGDVESARVIMDSATGRSRGYGIVIMDTINEPIQSLDGTVHKGMAITVTPD